jgi:hypothetical protein
MKRHVKVSLSPLPLGDAFSAGGSTPGYEIAGGAVVASLTASF